ncbi:hypothetical protein ACVGXH_04835, partial [Enterobacter intestinihominis]
MEPDQTAACKTNNKRWKTRFKYKKHSPTHHNINIIKKKTKNTTLHNDLKKLLYLIKKIRSRTNQNPV